MKINEIALISPKYSGEKKRNGTPKALPKPSETIENKRPQYISEIRLYLTIPNSNSIGKKTLIELSATTIFRKIRIPKYTKKKLDFSLKSVILITYIEI